MIVKGTHRQVAILLFVEVALIYLVITFWSSDSLLLLLPISLVILAYIRIFYCLLFRNFRDFKFDRNGITLSSYFNFSNGEYFWRNIREINYIKRRKEKVLLLATDRMTFYPKDLRLHKFSPKDFLEFTLADDVLRFQLPEQPEVKEKLIREIEKLSAKPLNIIESGNYHSPRW